MIFVIYSLFYPVNKAIKIFRLIAIVLGVYAILSSGTRGGWVAIFFILFLNMKYLSITRIQKIGIFTALALLFSGSYFIESLPVAQKVDKATQEINNYFYQNITNTSVGQRLELWKTSLIIIKNDYALGCGEGCFKVKSRKLFANGLINIGGIMQTEPHNQYLHILVEQGLLGLISFLMIFVIPLINCFQNVRNKIKTQPMPLLGVSVLGSLLFFMITDSTLDSQLNGLLYAFTIAFIYGQIRYEKLKGKNV